MLINTKAGFFFFIIGKKQILAIFFAFCNDEFNYGGSASLNMRIQQTIHHTSPGFYHNYNFSPLLMILIRAFLVKAAAGSAILR